MRPINNITLANFGEIKTTKTTFGLTAPKPLLHLDFDQGVDRAIWRFQEYSTEYVNSGTPLRSINLGEKDITTKEYVLPLDLPGNPNTGFVKMWEEEVFNDVVAACQNPLIKSIVIDTGTSMWGLASRAQLERARKTNPERQSLIPLEYRKPNDDMRSLFGAIKTTKKTLIVTHHLEGVYRPVWVKSSRGEPEYKESRVGDTWAGWSHIGGMVDMVARNFVENQYHIAIHGGSPVKVVATSDEAARNLVDIKLQPQIVSIQIDKGVAPKPFLIMEKCGLSLDAEGLRLDNPTVEGVVGLINALRNGQG